MVRDASEAGELGGGESWRAAAVMPARPGRSAVIAGVLAAALLVVAGCGGNSSSAPESAGGSVDPDVTAREADCSDWNEASAEQRQATIEALRELEGGPTTGGTGAVLPDERAGELFESYCSNRFARAFKLYKLYARAAAFRSLDE